MLKTIALVVVAAVVLLLGYAATRPDSFSVQRETVIAAPPARVFAQLDDFQRWRGWSPWEGLDPALRRSFSGPPAGPGAVYAWEGNKDVGKGRMEITDSQPPAKLTIRLDFIEPISAHNTAEFRLEPQGEGTRVTWVMFGPSPFLSKLMGVFFDMDKMIGKDFEAGLAKLKAVAEKP